MMQVFAPISRLRALCALVTGLITLVAAPIASGIDEPRAAAEATRHTLTSTLIVRFQPGVQPEPGATIGDALVADLQLATGAKLAVSSAPRTDNQVLTLAEPVTVAEAKRLLGILRMRQDVLWAEFERHKPADSTVKSAGTPGADDRAVIRQLIVTFSDPALGVMARNNQRLGEEWNALLSAGAGVPIRVVRPTVGGAWIVRLQSAVSRNRAEEIAAKLEATTGIRDAAPDYPASKHAYFPNDPYFQDGHQRNMANPLTTAYYGIDAPEAWDITTGSPLVVAVVDTGARPHDEFSSRLLDGYDFVSDPDNSHDGLGRHASGIDPGDWHTSDDCPGKDPEDSDWHGTHVTGIIAATGDNNEGITGINWYATILPVRVLGTCGGSDSDIIEGMAWAAGLPVPGVPDNATPAKVINMSLGGPGACSDLYQSTINQILAAGTFIAVSAGNDAGDSDDQSPASCFGVSTVAATDPYGFLASYSNSSTSIDIAAPGGDQSHYGHLYGIWSTLNTGTTVPEFSTFDAYQGTSQAAPHVSGVASLMLAVNPALSPAQIKSIMAETSSNFASASICVNSGTCGAGIVNAYNAVKEAQRLAPPVAAVNYTGLFWNSPAGSESGWGINFSHQGDVIFATWFTYDLTGKWWWLSMTANNSGNGTYAGTLYETHGPPYYAAPFSPAAVVATAVGTGTLSFSDANNGTFSYNVNGIAQTKAITRQVFGPLPNCLWGAQPNLALATNYQDLWWAAPAGAESGWGINFTQQGNTIFGTWFTYNADGTPLWLSVTANNIAPGVYQGELNLTTGPPFNAVPFNPSNVVASPLGTATLRFTSGNSGTFTYTVNAISGPVTQAKAITRQVFRAPGTVCQ